MAIEFTVKGANELYLNLNNLRLHVLANVTNADETNIEANTAAPINRTLQSMSREIGLEFNGRNVSDTDQLFRYRSHLENLLNFCQKNQEIRLLCKGWTKDTTGHMNVTARCKNNASLNARTATFAKSTLVELIGRTRLDVQQITPYSFKHRSPHEVDTVSKQLCIEFGSARSMFAAGQLKVGYPERQSHHLHQEVHQHGSWRTYGSTRTAKYTASRIARPNEKPVNSRDRDVYQL